MIKSQKQILYVLILIFLLMLPNIFFIWIGQDSAVITPIKRVVFFVYTLSLIFFSLSVIKPKIIFLILILLMPFSLIDLYVLSITGTQSTPMHYFSFFATNVNEALEFIQGKSILIVFALLYIFTYLFFFFRLKKDFSFKIKIRKIIVFTSLTVITVLFLRDIKIAASNSRSDMLEATFYHFFIKLDKTFPFGSVSKIIHVLDEVHQSNKFDEVNKYFSYKPVIDDKKDVRTIVLIIGETARKKNFQIYGYNRETNPKLKNEKNIIPFTNFTTCANFTNASVSQIITSVGPKNYDDLYKELGLPFAFKEAGYKTFWITNQMYSIGSIYNLLSKNSHVFKDVSTTLDMPNNDMVTLPLLKKYLKDNAQRKFIVIHSIGSHYRYNLRYPREFAVFKPELDNTISISENGIVHKKKYINSYDNSILFTDYFLSNVIDLLEVNKEQTIMMYVSDHGENLYDDEKELFLHGTSIPSKYELEIPMIIWHSNNYSTDIINRLKTAKDFRLSSEIIFHTLSSLGGFKTIKHNLELDILSDSLIRGNRTFLKPDGSVMKID